MLMAGWNAQPRLLIAGDCSIELTVQTAELKT